MSDSEAAASAKKAVTKKPLTDEQKAAAKARREEVIWSSETNGKTINIKGSVHSKLLNRTRDLISSYLKDDSLSNDQIVALLNERHPDASTEPLTCAHFIISDYIYRVQQSQEKKAAAPAKDKKEAGADKRKKPASQNASDDEHVANKHAKADAKAPSKADKAADKKKAKPTN